jgi:hypothetical protein
VIELFLVSVTVIVSDCCRFLRWAVSARPARRHYFLPFVGAGYTLIAALVPLIELVGSVAVM